MALIDSATIETRENMNSKVLNDVVAIETVMIPVNNKAKKLEKYYISVIKDYLT